MYSYAPLLNVLLLQLDVVLLHSAVFLLQSSPTPFKAVLPQFRVVLFYSAVFLVQ